MNIDLGPTFISLAGQQVPSYMDGKSLVPLLTAGQEQRAESFRSQLLVEHYGEHGFAITGCPQYQGQGMAVSTASSLSFLLHGDVSSVQQSRNDDDNDDDDDDCFYVALLSTLKETHCTRMRFYMSD